MHNQYIKLPIVKELEIKGYPLFKKDWKYEFKKGLNLFLGGNTLGKTTSVYILLYGIAGIPKDEKDFFKKRIKGGSANEIPTVRIKMDLDQTIIEIVRNLNDLNIIYLSINGQSYSNQNGDLNQIYENKITKLSGFSSLEDYRFLLEKLLIREEEGNYILWDTSDQARILRLLFGYEGFDKEFAKLEKEVKDSDSKVRDTQYKQSHFKDRLKATKINKADRLKQIGAFNIIDLQNKISNLDKDKGGISKEQEKFKKDIKILRSKKEILTKEVSNKSNKIEELEAEILNLENRFFGAIYSDPKMLLAHHKLELYGICMFCNQAPPADTRKEIISQTKQGICPVCGSKSPINFEPSIQDREVSEKIKTKREELLKFKKEFDFKTEEFKKIEIELDKHQKRYFELENTFSDIITEINDLKLRLNDIAEGKTEEIATYDSDIRRLEDDINYYQEKIDEAKDKYSISIDKLKERNEHFEKNLKNLEDNLVKIFQNYAGALFIQCELNINHLKPKGSKIYLPIFLPKIGGVLRKNRTQASKSEAVFLEYAFRLSLCEYYNEITGNNLNLIIETLEGIFDMGVIKMLSETLVKFARNNYYLLIVSNLGREDFLKSLITKYDADMSQRTVNFFEIGELSEIQKDELPEYEKIMNELIKNQFKE